MFILPVLHQRRRSLLSSLVFLLSNAILAVVVSSYVLPYGRAASRQEAIQQGNGIFRDVLRVENNEDQGKRRRRRKDSTSLSTATTEQSSLDYAAPPNRDAMIARAAVLRQSLLKQQLELQELERQIACCKPINSNLNKGIGLKAPDNPVDLVVRTAAEASQTFTNSFNVLLRKLNRVKEKNGKNNKKYKSVEDYVVTQTKTGLRILDGLARNPTKIKQLVDPATPTLIPHLPSIYARLDKLEIHVDPILEKVLNNRQHFASIEPCKLRRHLCFS